MIVFVIPYGSFTSEHPLKSYKCIGFNFHKQETYELNTELYDGKDNSETGRIVCQKIFDTDSEYFSEIRNSIHKIIKKHGLKLYKIKDDIYVDKNEFFDTNEYISIIGDMMIMGFDKNSNILNKITKVIDDCAKINVSVKIFGESNDFIKVLNKKMVKEKVRIVDTKNILFMKQRDVINNLVKTFKKEKEVNDGREESNSL